MLYKINDSILIYRENLDDYYQYIVELIKKVIEKKKIIITLGEENSENYENSIKIKINYEHTLVKEGGRSVPDHTPFGDIKYGNKNYLVRIDRYGHLDDSNIIIDYSCPNIKNVKSCPIYESFSKKHIYISPSLYNVYFLKENRNITTLTTFINTCEPRRCKLLQNLTNHINVNNCFETLSMINLLKNTKIIINIHQTPHHDTFEELRVLPALECGVIVISENSPLSELIPYNDLIIWSDYDTIIEKLKEVIENYDIYHDKIFTEENINKLNNLKKINYDVLEKAILNLDES
jgi:hypothetical protein